MCCTRHDVFVSSYSVKYNGSIKKIIFKATTQIILYLFNIFFLITGL